MAELPPIKKPPKQSSKGLGFFFAPTKGKNSVKMDFWKPYKLCGYFWRTRFFIWCNNRGWWINIFFNMGRSNGCINLFYSSYFKVITPLTLAKSKGTMTKIDYKLKGKAFYICACVLAIIPIVLFLIWAL